MSERGPERDEEGIQIRKSGCIEFCLGECTVGYNTALGPCRVWKAAYNFFEASDVSDLPSGLDALAA
jgi:hypothetical protein